MAQSSTDRGQKPPYFPSRLREVPEDEEQQCDERRRAISTSGWATGRSRTGGCASGSPARTSGTSSRPRARRGRSWAASATRTTYRTDHDGGFVGMSFRFFDPTTRRVVDLLGGQPPAGAARPAGDRLVLGRHRRLRGRRHVQGQPIRVRFTWSRRDHAEPRWEQAFSDDGGETWETNWVNDFTRAGGGSMSAARAGVAPATARQGDRAGRAIALGATALKWYDIAPADEPVPGPIRRWPARAARTRSTPARSTWTTTSAS